MNEEINTNEEQVVEEPVNKKDEFDQILQKIKKMSEAVELHDNVKKAVSDNEVDDTYLRYIENALEEKLFDDAKFDKLQSKILIEVVCPELVNIENFKIENLEILDISSHYEELEHYIDKVCMYDKKFVCMFGIDERNADKVLKYDSRKFIRADMIEAIMHKVENYKVSNIEQYDEYYIVNFEEGFRIYSERKSTALVKLEENFLDKMKSKLSSMFTVTLFSKKKCLPKIDIVYDSNQNRFKDFKTTTTSSKVDAKKRMKALLTNERKVTRSTENV